MTDIEKIIDIDASKSCTDLLKDSQAEFFFAKNRNTLNLLNCVKEYKKDIYIHSNVENRKPLDIKKDLQKNGIERLEQIPDKKFEEFETAEKRTRNKLGIGNN